MSELLPMFTTDYRDHQFVIDFYRRQNGITTKLQVLQGQTALAPVTYDNLWSNYEDAKVFAIKDARRLIDDLIKKNA